MEKADFENFSSRQYRGYLTQTKGNTCIASTAMSRNMYTS